MVFYACALMLLGPRTVHQSARACHSVRDILRCRANARSRLYRGHSTGGRLLGEIPLAVIAGPFLPWATTPGRACSEHNRTWTPSTSCSCTSLCPQLSVLCLPSTAPAVLWRSVPVEGAPDGKISQQLPSERTADPQRSAALPGVQSRIC